MIDKLTTMLGLGERELIRVRTSPSGYGGPVPFYTLVLRLDQEFGFSVETIQESEDDSRRWRVPIDPSEAQEWLDRLSQSHIAVFLESPVSTDGEYVEVTVHGRGADLTIGWWNIPPMGAEVFGAFVEWLFAHSPVHSFEGDDDEALYDRLVRLTQSLSSSLLHIDRKAVQRKVLARTIAYLKKLPSPAPMENNDSMFDFLGEINAGHADNELYELAFGAARNELERQVSALDDDSQVVLLLPMMDDDIEDLARDWDIDEWARLLRGQSEVWIDELMRALMARIPERYLS